MGDGTCDGDGLNVDFGDGREGGTGRAAGAGHDINCRT